MKTAGHVGRRNYNTVGVLGRIAGRLERPAIFPTGVDALFDLSGLKCLAQHFLLLLSSFHDGCSAGLMQGFTRSSHSFQEKQFLGRMAAKEKTTLSGQDGS